MLAPSAAGLVLVCLLASQWSNPSFAPQTDDPMLAVLAMEHSAANHIARVSGQRAVRSLPTIGLSQPSVALAVTGMVAFPLLRPTNP
jgi:hypothetical protein